MTVLASGDQAFHCMEKGAINIDCFDINKLTYYYFILRIWLIKYNDLYYVDEDNILYEASKLLKRILPETDNEKKAYLFWKLLLKEINDIGVLFRHVGLYNGIYSLEKIKKFVSNNAIPFHNIDFLEEEVNWNNTYDVLILSNIHEYADINRMRIYVNNIYNLLEDDGYAVISNFEYLPDDKLSLLLDNFMIKDIPEYNFYVKEYPIGNILTKK